MELCNTAEDYENDVEVNLIHHHQENPHHPIVLRANHNSNNGKKNHKKVPISFSLIYSWKFVYFYFLRP